LVGQRLQAHSVNIIAAEVWQASSGKALANMAAMAMEQPLHVTRECLRVHPLLQILHLPKDSTALQQPPLFLMAPAFGSSGCFLQLATTFTSGTERRVYGLDRGVDDMVHLAELHCETIESVVPRGEAVHLGGYSHGGIVALKTAEFLLTRGRVVLKVFILDSHDPTVPPPEETEELQDVRRAEVIESLMQLSGAPPEAMADPLTWLCQMPMSKLGFKTDDIPFGKDAMQREIEHQVRLPWTMGQCFFGARIQSVSVVFFRALYTSDGLSHSEKSKRCHTWLDHLPTTFVDLPAHHFNLLQHEHSIRIISLAMALHMCCADIPESSR